jgi:alpha-beta hydrolase superfamily lysophospholipase
MKKAKSKNVKFASRDSLKLHGTLTTPGGTTRGLMLMAHGITSDRSEWGIFDLIAEEVAKEGVASFRFDFRGHGESHLDTKLITLAGILSDINSAWQELESATVRADLKRYVVGSSFGGGLAYAAASSLGGFDQAFLIAPVFNYLVDIDHCAPKWRTELKRKDHFKYNDLALGRALANEAIYFDPLSGAAVPTTIFHGSKDTDVSIDLSRKVVRDHASIRLVEVKGAGHVMNVPEDYDLEDEQSWTYIRSMVRSIQKAVS